MSPSAVRAVLSRITSALRKVVTAWWSSQGVEPAQRRRVAEHAVRWPARSARQPDTVKIRHAIYAQQLRALGIAFAEEDLRRHDLLRRTLKGASPPDRDYVDWAEAWLLRLRAANQGTGHYPEPAFSQLLDGLWRRVSEQAMP